MTSIILIIYIGLVSLTFNAMVQYSVRIVKEKDKIIKDLVIEISELIKKLEKLEKIE